MRQFFKANWVLFLILALALFFRFWQITQLPAGLFPDEAANGLDINSMRQGELAPFYERGNGREALFFHFEWLSTAIFGVGVWQFHIVSAMFGFASVVATYFLAKRLFDKHTALLATFFMAISSYAVTVSRTAFRANMVPLLSILTIYFLVKFFQTEDTKSKYWSAFWAGLFFALGFYTYTSFRMMLPLVIGFGALLFLAHRAHARQLFKTYAKYKAVFTSAFILGISWIASYFIQHPQSFVGRAGHVSIFNKDLNNGDILGTFIDVVQKTMLSFFTHGDLNWRHNVSGFPFLSPLISPLFALALVIFTYSLFKFLKQVYEQKLEKQTVYQALVASWFWLMLVPEITTAEGIPHGLRLIGVIPPLFILTGYGAHWLWQKFPHHHTVKFEKAIFATVFFMTLFFYNFGLYFGIAANSPEYYKFFRGDLTLVSEHINQRNLKDRTYLALDKFWLQTVDYLTTPTNQAYTAVEPVDAYKTQMKKGDQMIFTQSTLFDRIEFIKTHPNAKLVLQGYDHLGNIVALIYEQQ